MNSNNCKTCGSPLNRVDDYTWSCPYCLNVYTDEKVKTEAEILKSLLSDYKIEQVGNLRRNLYDAINAEYTDSVEICRICSEIKKLLPDDFSANFFYTANHGTPKEICEALRNVDATEQGEYAEMIVTHIISSMRSEYALPLQNIVERAYKQSDLTKYELLTTKISSELEKVNAGIYETALPREAFIAYSSKDMAKVMELVEHLEANGIDCFVAARNLRHGRGAVQNYENALHEAMDNCGAVVFVSSRNSRNTECDALRVELKYIKSKDILNSPPEYRQNYAKMPQKYKKPRIEYRIDNTSSQVFADRITTEFFSGLEYAYSPDEVLDRLYNLDTGFDEEEIQAPPTKKNLKYCAECGAENAGTVKFCCECGNNSFTESFEEYVLLMRKKLESEKQRAEDERRRAEEEKRKADEVLRKSAERKTNPPDTSDMLISDDDADCGIFLMNCGSSKLSVIKEIRAFTGLGLKEAKDLSESAPGFIASSLSHSRANAFKTALEEAGATVRLVVNKPQNGNSEADVSELARRYDSSSYSLTLEVTGSKKLNVIKVIREAFGIDLATAKRISESTPYTFSEYLTDERAMKLKKELEDVGATASIKVL